MALRYIEENFSPEAAQMRGIYDAHFTPPHMKAGPSQQVWDYWHVPDMYTYLRTSPQLVLGNPSVQQFMNTLRVWASERLNLHNISWPYLSLYINGCGQGLHNDATNGRYAYVYSLTRWDTRMFVGGETICFKEDAYWGTERAQQAGAGTSFYDLIPARFNQLVIFDDRLIHGVQPVQGTMNPLDGRIVLHGHIS